MLKRLIKLTLISKLLGRILSLLEAVLLKLSLKLVSSIFRVEFVVAFLAMFETVLHPTLEVSAISVLYLAIDELAMLKIPRKDTLLLSPLPLAMGFVIL
jgi:hypothetical protein